MKALDMNVLARFFVDDADDARAVRLRPAALAAVDALDQGLDFADALHLARSAHASGFLTFDQRLSKRAKALGLTPPVELLV